MKKIIALALALIMALSMASVAFAATTVRPGEKESVMFIGGDAYQAKREWKIVSTDFTSANKGVAGYKGVSMVDDVVIDKDGNVYVVLKESLTSTDAKAVVGEVVVATKDGSQKHTLPVDFSVENIVKYVAGEKKAANAIPLTDAEMAKNTVMVVDEAGYVKFTAGASLAGTVKLAKDEKAQVYLDAIDDDTKDAIDEYLGEDYEDEAIVEYINFAGTGFKNDVDFQYDAYAEDPHFFYAWDGEKFVDLEAKFNDDEEVEKYEFTAPAQGIIIVTDVEIVAAAEEDTKNPDTGANDVVGVAAALAVVSLVAAGAVSLKK